jgi:serine O-acetyltransferase
MYMVSLRARLSALTQLPLILAATRSPVREAVDRDVRRWLQPRLDRPLPDVCTRIDLARALRHRPLRTVLYARLGCAGGLCGLAGRLLRLFYRGEIAMEVNCVDVGGGLLFMHGFATIVIAERIGVDCQISQQVTVGYDDRGGPPVLGDRVRIGANAVVIGPVTIGDDAVVGAGAVVTKDVRSGAVVVGVPARELKNATDRYSALRRAT